MNIEINKTHLGHSLEVLKSIDSESVDMCVTSPPYWGLRDYGEEDQLGLEPTPDEYVLNMMQIFDEVYRVLKSSGTLWINLGDTYSSFKDCKSTSQTIAKGTNSEKAHVIIKGKSVSRNTKKLKSVGLKNKDLIGIPWMMAFALRSNGWYLRQDIIWHKPNPMPESVTDRCTKSHEYIFLLSKSAKYYYDHESIKEPVKDETISRMGRGVGDNHKNINGAPGQTPHTMNQPRINKKMSRNPRKGIDNRGGNQASKDGIPAMAIHGSGITGHSGYYDKDGNLIGNGMANKKSVWTVTTKPFKDSHFATFPPDLIVPCIKAGCPEGGIVLDPFHGAGTTGMVARKLNRNFIGIELNPEYIEISERRMQKELGMFQ